MTTTTTTELVDPITLGVIWRGLTAAANDAGTTLARTGYSEAIREGRDFSVGLFDSRARMTAQGDFSPGHLGSMPTAVKNVLDYYPTETLKPGDAIMLNDPWMGSGHLPDFFLVSPAFLDGEIIGYTVCCAHMIDVGGAVPGSQAVTGITDQFQEGIRFLPVRVWNEGEPNVELFRTLAANIRIPDKLIGDLKAMRNCNRLGELRLQGLVRQFGRKIYEAACDEILVRSEQAMREAIAEIPDGTYHAVDHFDDCGPDTEPIRLEVTVTVQGDEVILDFAGTSPQTRSGINGVEQYVRAWCYFTIKVLTLGSSVPQNAGCIAPIKWTAPEGSVLNAKPPAGTGARAVMQQRIFDVLMQAFATAIPDRVMAASSHFSNPVIGGIDPRTGKNFVYYEVVVGGFGAFGFKDGTEAMFAVANIDTIPTEVNENSYPIIVERYEFLRGTAGAGKFRGGHGVRKDIRLLGDSMQLTGLTDRQTFRPPGLLGGSDGTLGATVLNPDTPEERKLHSKGIYDVEPGALLSTNLAGAAGFGNPFEREPRRVAADVRAGLLTPEAAREEYRVVLDQSGSIDESATRELRSPQR
ncbi:hydantoinase B/oxoprolinase family protein [Mycobacterium sp. DL440]|uniref:hydantoinase B/oxoprolinase family protein n=1 Tax=Mycobacterium sp. DL440 TaxID=2675523 RepID=UPI00142253B8|nr:hydantoinase B/oxoprolinase family protein [Mycobacterium sp. DL440]